MNRRSPPLPTFLQNWKDRKVTPQEHQCHLDNKLASFVALLDTSPKTVQNPAQLPPKPKHPSLIRTSPCLPEWTLKKTEQSLRLCTTKDCVELPHAKNSYSQHICSFKSSLTHSFPDFWHPSRYDLEVPCGFQIFWILHWFCVCADSASPSLWHSTYQALTYQWNLQFHHLTGTRLANPFSYWGIPEPDFYVTPLDQSCTIVLGYCWLYTTIPQLTGIGQHLFLATVAAWIQELTLCQDTSIISTISETSGLCPRSPNPVLL